MAGLALQLVGGAGVLGVVWCLLALRVNKAAHDLGASFLLGAAIVLLPNATMAVAQFTGGRIEGVDGVYNLVVTLEGPATTVNAWASPLLMLLCLGYLCLRLWHRPAPNAVAVLVLVILVVGSMAALAQGQGGMSGGRLTLMSAIAAVILAPRDLRLLRGAAWALALLVSLSAALAVVAPTTAAPECGDRKCGLFGTLYVGIADNNNALGLLMALAVPVIYFGLRRRPLLFAVGASFLAFASGSRTAEVATAAVLALIVLREVCLRVSKPWWEPAAVAAAAVAQLSVIAAPFLGLDPTSLTGRAGLWDLALNEVRSSWLIGLGPELWRSFVDDGLIDRASEYSTHNQFLEILFVSGVLGVVLAFCALILLMRRSRNHIASFSILVTPALILGVTERPWSVGQVDWMSWSLIVTLAVIGVRLGGEVDTVMVDGAAGGKLSQLLAH